MLMRTMVMEDLDIIVRMEKELFSSPWSKDDFIYELTVNPFSRNLVLEEHGDIIGYIGFWLLGDQTQITTVGIKKEMQGKGYSKQLMEACIAITKEQGYPNITLEVRISNKKAICLYEHFGFRIVAIRKNYYQDTHEDAYLMSREMEV